MASLSASHDASTMFSLTPTVPHTSLVVARFDHHPHAGGRALLRVHDAHLVIDELHLVEPAG